jgi:2-polyprenyl-6-methoxyphenol hydroxylase-like FAD-dependent oxidoreductase
MPPKVAIIGAGPAGLTLASLLHASGQKLDVTIFEKDASAAARTRKGGTLDLHEGTGLAAMRAAGLWNSFLKYARYEGEAIIFGDKKGNKVFDSQANRENEDVESSRPEIDRERLKEILLESIPDSWIRWGSRLRSVSEDGSLSFDHGAEGPFGLLVGADGAWSKVRSVLVDTKVSFAGISGFEMRIVNPTHDHPRVSDMIGRGSYFAYSDCKALQALRQGDDSIMAYAWSRNTEEFPTKLWEEVAQDGEKLKQVLLDTLFKDWAPEMQEWIKVASSDSIRPWPLYELPVGMTWEHKKGITLIGDSAHLMTPFAGEGVNCAMKDSLELAEAIIESIKSGRDLDAAVKQFEEAMFPRTKQVTEMTMMMKTYQFREDAPWGFMEKMKEIVELERGKAKGENAGVDLAAS